MNYLIIVRHGFYYSSASDPDESLNARGIKQIQHLGEALKKKYINKKIGIYCSPTKRTKESAAILSEELYCVPMEAKVLEWGWGNKDEDGIMELIEKAAPDNDVVILITHAECCVVTAENHFWEVLETQIRVPALEYGEALIIDCNSKTYEHIRA